ncbi:MAG: hypothetical protein HN377_09020 [Alphaproteobacteria bacterium]|nr:hypothetical protein [Alphaproteobacteria bacterium]MBT7943376.1 hypothetical protein [Alphaproteobacteria bacterium]
MRSSLILILVMFGLSACGGYDFVSNKLSNPIILNCPDYRVVADAASLIKFQDGPGRDLVDVNYEGQITGVQLGCISNIDKKTRTGTMVVDVSLSFIATRGPANRNRTARFDYFVSVVDPKLGILDRQGYPLQVSFPGNKTRVEFASNPIILELPITAKWRVSYYQIFVGLKLSREELSYNREKINRSRK